MKWDQTKLERIFQRTDGHCHICRAKLHLSRYGQMDKSGAWEVEHSVPRAKGGTDHLNNLYAACISCNRSKGSNSTSKARAKNGYKKAPLPREKKVDNAITGGAIGSLAFLLVPPQFKLLAMVVGTLTGAKIGYDSQPD
jgi:5-methylcytosine-specific restriction endonuclease McrA